MNQEPNRSEGSHGSQTEGPAMNSRTTQRWFVREFIGVAFLGLLLFVSAGHIDWPMAWMLLAIMVAWIVATAIVVLQRNPDLLAERLSLRHGAKGWDTALMSVIGTLVIVRSVIAGLDVRFGWSSPLAVWLQIGAMVGVCAGYVLVVWATGANAHFFADRTHSDRA
jgi:hypothetical protein